MAKYKGNKKGASGCLSNRSCMAKSVAKNMAAGYPNDKGKPMVEEANPKHKKMK